MFQLVRQGFADEEGGGRLLRLMLKTKFVGIFAEKTREGVREMLDSELENTQNYTKTLFDSLVFEWLLQGTEEKLSPEKTKELGKRMLRFDKGLLEAAKSNSRKEMEEE